MKRRPTATLNPIAFAFFELSSLSHEGFQRLFITFLISVAQEGKRWNGFQRKAACVRPGKKKTSCVLLYEIDLSCTHLLSAAPVSETSAKVLVASLAATVAADCFFIFY